MQTIEGDQSLVQTVGRRVREAREALGWTAQELADEADMAQSYVIEIENGQKNPTVGALENLAIALDVKLSFLVGNGG